MLELAHRWVCWLGVCQSCCVHCTACAGLSCVFDVIVLSCCGTICAQLMCCCKPADRLSLRNWAASSCRVLPSVIQSACLLIEGLCTAAYLLQSGVTKQPGELSGDLHKATWLLAHAGAEVTGAVSKTLHAGEGGLVRCASSLSHCAASLWHCNLH